MPFKKILIANRGEVALRILFTAQELNIDTVVVFAPDDENTALVKLAGQSLPLKSKPAYLDIEEIIKIASETGCDAIHPGYGFLSENPNFAQAVMQAGISFIGPTPEVLTTLGHKEKALALAIKNNIPVAARLNAELTQKNVNKFLESLPGNKAIIKATAGGGGRGMRIVTNDSDIESLVSQAKNEAQAAFNDGSVYLEEFIDGARHIEVQVLADQHGNVRHAFERDCTLQRRHQKVIELAPAPNLTDKLRTKLYDAALTLAQATQYTGLCTIEFLVKDDAFYFIEANPRLQVEHTITEEITGLDLVACQLNIAAGKSIKELTITKQRAQAIQLRVNAESIKPDGNITPATEAIEVFDAPTGPGVRIDSHAFSGYAPSPAYDSLLAKLILSVAHNDLDTLLTKAVTKLNSFRIEGPATNIPFLRGILNQKEVPLWKIDTGFIDRSPELILKAGLVGLTETTLEKTKQPATQNKPIPVGFKAIHAVTTGIVGRIYAKEGQSYQTNAELLTISAMKMEHLVTAPEGLQIHDCLVAEGDTVRDGDQLFFYAAQELAGDTEDVATTDLTIIREDLAEVFFRKELTLDEGRPRAVNKRRRRGQQTVRENIGALVDKDSFVEYGGFALAAQRSRRTLAELIKLSPADGLVTGLASVGADIFGSDASRCALMAYDYTVFAGTQGAINHKKTDRLLHLVHDRRLPLFLFAEGGGGRPGDVEVAAVGGLDLPTFKLYASLSGLVPRIAVAAGRCFAGNAALFGCSDIRIATSDATIGMGGPVMIKGAGLGRFSAEEVGPAAMHAKSGVLDIVAADEKEAVVLAKTAMGYFQGALPGPEYDDQRKLRFRIPENRKRAYDIRALVHELCDFDSVLELRKEFGRAIVTAFVRIDGIPFGLIANDPAVMAGAIDADAADKASHFLALCDGFDIPIISLCDTPGIMVGPDAESEALVGKASRFFSVAASLTVPFFTVVVRRGYGLGAMAMAGGSFHGSDFTVAWPTGEFGAMGLEGAVEIGYAKELAKIKDWDERQKKYEELVAAAYEHGKALNTASFIEIDNVIDPADTRDYILKGLQAMPKPPVRTKKKRTYIDPW